MASIATLRLSNGVPLVPLREHDEYRKVIRRGASLDDQQLSSGEETKGVRGAWGL